MEGKGEEEDSLSLLAAMIDGNKDKGEATHPAKVRCTDELKLKVPAAGDSKGLSRGSERKGRGEGSSGRGVKRKRPREDGEESGAGRESRETPGEDSMAEMKGG